MTISNNLIPESIQVFLVRDETETTNIYRISSYRTDVVAPPFLASGTYMVKVITSEKTVASSSTVSITENTAYNFITYLVSPKKVKEAGTFTITGKNFTDGNLIDFLRIFHRILNEIVISISQ